MREGGPERVLWEGGPGSPERGRRRAHHAEPGREVQLAAVPRELAPPERAADVLVEPAELDLVGFGRTAVSEKECVWSKADE
jgi:hypothetical protein